VTIRTQVRDRAALQAAYRRLGLKVPGRSGRMRIGGRLCLARAAGNDLGMVCTHVACRPAATFRKCVNFARTRLTTAYRYSTSPSCLSLRRPSIGPCRETSVRETTHASHRPFARFPRRPQIRGTTPRSTLLWYEMRRQDQDNPASSFVPCDPLRTAYGCWRPWQPWHTRIRHRLSAGRNADGRRERTGHRLGST
jgi:hypothetical protein